MPSMRSGFLIDFDRTERRGNNSSATAREFVENEIIPITKGTAASTFPYAPGCATGRLVFFRRQLSGLWVRGNVQRGLRDL